MTNENITDRVLAELRLVELNATAPPARLANRRRFDHQWHIEWGAACACSAAACCCT